MAERCKVEGNNARQKRAHHGGQGDIVGRMNCLSEMYMTVGRKSYDGGYGNGTEGSQMERSANEDRRRGEERMRRESDGRKRTGKQGLMANRKKGSRSSGHSVGTSECLHCLFIYLPNKCRGRAGTGGRRGRRGELPPPCRPGGRSRVGPCCPARSGRLGVPARGGAGLGWFFHRFELAPAGRGRGRPGGRRPGAEPGWGGVEQPHLIDVVRIFDRVQIIWRRSLGQPSLSSSCP